MKKLPAICSLLISIGLASCGSSRDPSDLLPASETTTTVNQSGWPDQDKFIELMKSLNKSTSLYFKKAMTYEEYIESINLISLNVQALAASDRVNCPNALSKVALEVNQLRVAMINKSEQDIQDGLKVAHPTYFMTALGFCS
jgi:hypothetical protein